MLFVFPKRITEKDSIFDQTPHCFFLFVSLTWKSLVLHIAWVPLIEDVMQCATITWTLLWDHLDWGKSWEEVCWLWRYVALLLFGFPLVLNFILILIAILTTNREKRLQYFIGMILHSMILRKESSWVWWGSKMSQR